MQPSTPLPSCVSLPPEAEVWNLPIFEILQKDLISYKDKRHLLTHFSCLFWSGILREGSLHLPGKEDILYIYIYINFKKPQAHYHPLFLS